MRLLRHATNTIEAWIRRPNLSPSCLIHAVLGLFLFLLCLPLTSLAEAISAFNRDQTALSWVFLWHDPFVSIRADAPTALGLADACIYQQAFLHASLNLPP